MLSGSEGWRGDPRRIAGGENVTLPSRLPAARASLVVLNGEPVVNGENEAPFFIITQYRWTLSTCRNG